ncbi:MAG: hypothetical protein DRH24_14885 [Deltaproteobacteria bacterium]|nr:MAG: hypothetical protein DRH24_14885 [Deltaproteobacteria bacterium]
MIRTFPKKVCEKLLRREDMRKIKKAKIQFISLVPKGANNFPVLFKADGSIEIRSLTKMQEEGELLSVVYAPGIVDSQGDFADAKVIKEMAYDFLRRGGEIDLQHSGKPLSKEQAFVAESFLIHKGDERFKDFRDYSGKKVDVTGGWGMVIKIEDEELRKLYREGQWNGVSMFGPAQMEEVAEVEKENALLSLVKKILGQKTEDVDVDEIKEMLSKMNQRLEALEAEKKAALEKLQKEAEEQKQKELEALKKKIEELEKQKKDEKSDEKETPEEKLARLQKEKEEADKKAAELKKELEELQKASNQPPEDEDLKKSDKVVSLSKADLELVELGRKMAKAVNAEIEKKKK